MRLTRPLFALFLLVGLACAQQPTLDQANAAMTASDFVKAAALFQQVTVSDACNGAAWEGLGNASIRLDHFDGANQAFQRAIDLKWRPYLNRLNLARVAAKQGNGANAIQMLQELAATGKAAQLRPYLQMEEFVAL